jgi:hypothetical protein
MTDAPHERSPEATKRLARLAGAVYVLLGITAAFGFYHAPLVQGAADSRSVRLPFFTSSLHTYNGLVHGRQMRSCS